MKALFLISLMIGLVTVLDASPLTKSWTDLKPGMVFKKIGDIWSDCGKDSDMGKIDSLTITPDPPVKGQDITVKATFTLTEQITSGQIKVSAKYGIIPVYDSTLDLCDIADQAGLSCPLASGDHSLEITKNLPSLVPSGHYTGDAKVTDQNGNEVACIDIDLHL